MKETSLLCLAVLLQLWSWGVAQAEPPDANQRPGLRCISTSGFPGPADARIAPLHAALLVAAAPPLAAEPPPAAAPADLRELTGQAVPGERDLQSKYAEVMIEWGFEEKTAGRAFDGSIEATQTGVVGKATPLPGDRRSMMTGDRAWKSPPAADGARRGIVVPLLIPITGKIRLRAKVVQGHPRGGDGVSWSIVRESKTGREVLAQGAVDQGGSQSIPAAGAEAGKLAGVAVQKSDGLALVIGRRTHYACDTTFVELVIEEIGGSGRCWDLTKDVVGGICGHSAPPSYIALHAQLVTSQAIATNPCPANLRQLHGAT